MFDETFLISDHHAPSRDHDELFVGHGEFAPVRRADDEGAKSIRDFLADLFRLVDPDIVVDNDPAKEFKGEDQQLNRAIEEIQADLKTKRYDLPPVPPYPNRNPAKPN